MIDLKNETILSLSSAAARLGVSHRTIRKWASRIGSRLETAKVGGKVITSLEALQRFSRQRGEDDQQTTTFGNGNRASERAIAEAKRELASIGIT